MTWREAPNFRLWRGDFRDALATIPDDHYDCVFTDPPFATATHDGALTTVGADDEAKLIDFDALSDEGIREHFGLLSRVCGRWLVATMEWRHVAYLEKHPPRGFRFVRFGVWIKDTYKPQISGDRPATGWEAIGMFHRDEKGRPRKMHWNGGGKSAVYRGNKENGGLYPTQKPLWLMRAFIRDFADKGGRIFDPYGGSGTTGVAALLEHHPVDVCEMRTEPVETSRGSEYPQEIIWRRLTECQPEGTEAVMLKQGRMF